MPGRLHKKFYFIRMANFLSEKHNNEREEITNFEFSQKDDALRFLWDVFLGPQIQSNSNLPSSKNSGQIQYTVLFAADGLFISYYK